MQLDEQTLSTFLSLLRARVCQLPHETYAIFSMFRTFEGNGMNDGVSPNPECPPLEFLVSPQLKICPDSDTAAQKNPPVEMFTNRSFVSIRYGTFSYFDSVLFPRHPEVFYPQV